MNDSSVIAMRVSWCFVVLLTWTSASSGLAELPWDYNRDVRPILAKNCFACHGLDEENREAGLRLDVRSAALAELDSGATAIVPGQAWKSELITRITSKDPDLQMPPSDGPKRLSESEIAVLTQWVDQGADYDLH